MVNSASQFNIFVVEDDLRVRGELITLLERNGYAVQTSDDFAHLSDAILEANPSLVLLDLTLPVCDGQVICAELRRHSTVPIIVVTSRDNTMDELLCLSLGADDFVTKPYDSQILLAHISSLLRRVYASEADPQLICGGVTLDVARSEVRYGEQSAELTKNELRLLHLLMQRSGTIVARADLQNELWQSDEFVDDNTLTVNINRLRSTLEGLGVSPDFLQTRRGQGYMIDL
jgi:DNA-binding response OmpR family regulator